jgi:tRNA pseudouridine-54 N-methylase
MKISNALYLSPNLRYDAVAQVVIIQRLNPETGEVTFQTPSRAAIREERAAVTSIPRAAVARQPARTAESSVSPADAVKQGHAAEAEAHISILV